MASSCDDVLTCREKHRGNSAADGSEERKAQKISQQLQDTCRASKQDEVGDDRVTGTDKPPGNAMAYQTPNNQSFFFSMSRLQPRS
jgi:hypothetical protein